MLKMQFGGHFKGMHFAQVINPRKMFNSWTFIRHHFITKR